MDFGWAELLIIGVVALIVIGPKDLPEMFRTLGRFTAKARSMARDFSRAMEQAARDSGVDEVAKDLKDIKTATSPRAMGLDAVKSAADKFEKWDPLKNAAKPTSPPPKMPVPPPMPPTPAMAAASADAAPAATAPAAAVPAKPPLGPATQALADKQAKKAAIAREAAERLRAVDAEPAPAAPPKAAPRAAPKSANTKAAKPAPAAAKPPAKAPAKRTAAKAQDKTE